MALTNLWVWPLLVRLVTTTCISRPEVAWIKSLFIPLAFETIPMCPMAFRVGLKNNNTSPFSTASTEISLPKCSKSAELRGTIMSKCWNTKYTNPEQSNHFRCNPPLHKACLNSSCQTRQYCLAMASWFAPKV
jgi:hypothetical protein